MARAYERVISSDGELLVTDERITHIKTWYVDLIPAIKVDLHKFLDRYLAILSDDIPGEASQYKPLLSELERDIRANKNFSAPGERADDSEKSSVTKSSERTQTGQKKRTRRDLLTPIIEDAQVEIEKKAGDPFDYMRVFALLSKWAKARTPPFIGVTEDGLQWLNTNDKPSYLSSKSLEKRIDRQKKKARHLEASNTR